MTSRIESISLKNEKTPSTDLLSVDSSDLANPLRSGESQMTGKMLPTHIRGWSESLKFRAVKVRRRSSTITTSTYNSSTDMATLDDSSSTVNDVDSLNVMTPSRKESADESHLPSSRSDTLNVDPSLASQEENNSAIDAGSDSGSTIRASRHNRLSSFVSCESEVTVRASDMDHQRLARREQTETMETLECCQPEPTAVLSSEIDCGHLDESRMVEDKGMPDQENHNELAISEAPEATTVNEVTTVNKATAIATIIEKATPIINEATAIATIATIATVMEKGTPIVDELDAAPVENEVDSLPTQELKAEPLIDMPEPENETLENRRTEKTITNAISAGLEDRAIADMISHMIARMNKPVVQKDDQLSTETDAEMPCIEPVITMSKSSIETKAMNVPKQSGDLDATLMSDTKTLSTSPIVAERAIMMIADTATAPVATTCQTTENDSDDDSLYKFNPNSGVSDLIWYPMRPKMPFSSVVESAPPVDLVQQFKRQRQASETSTWSFLDDSSMGSSDSRAKAMVARNLMRFKYNELVEMLTGDHNGVASLPKVDHNGVASLPNLSADCVAHMDKVQNDDELSLTPNYHEIPYERPLSTSSSFALEVEQQFRRAFKAEIKTVVLPVHRTVITQGGHFHEGFVAEICYAGSPVAEGHVAEICFAESPLAESPVGEGHGAEISVAASHVAEISVVESPLIPQSANPLADLLKTRYPPVHRYPLKTIYEDATVLEEKIPEKACWITPNIALEVRQLFQAAQVKRVEMPVVQRVISHAVIVQNSPTIEPDMPTNETVPEPARRKSAFAYLRQKLKLRFTAPSWFRRLSRSRAPQETTTS